jgi:hypothetical protein
VKYNSTCYKLCAWCRSNVLLQTIDNPITVPECKHAGTHTAGCALRDDGVVNAEVHREMANESMKKSPASFASSPFKDCAKSFVKLCTGRSWLFNRVVCLRAW